ncbi:MAG: hypothetical protein GX573_16310, partial [Chloroflexi bacterium]|nr:hypothetical protein [Chloroflexota bacterium]
MYVSKKLKKAVLVVLALVLTLLNITPLIWTFMSGFKTRLEIFTIPPVWIPASLNLANYETIFDKRMH